MITKVRQLTRMNVNALNEIGAGKTVGVTVAEFEGLPGEALARLNSQIADACPDDSTYRSLAAVKRKLLAADMRFDASNPQQVNLTPYVSVIR